MDTYASSAGDPGGLLRHRRPGPERRRLLRHGLRHERRVDAVADRPAHRHGFHRPRGPPGVQRGRPRFEGHPGRAVLRLRLADDGARSGGGGHRWPDAAQLFARSPRPSIPSYWDPTTQTAWTSYQVGAPVAPDVVRQPDVAGVEGPTGRLLPHRRGGHLGAGHGRQRPGHAGGAARERPGGEELRRRPRYQAGTGRLEHDHHDERVGRGVQLLRRLGPVTGFADRRCPRLPARQR